MNLLITFLKGIVMGLADLVPGVSGGTLAFILGIYQRFISALSEIDSQLFKLLFQGKIKVCWEKIDGWFLMPLGLGIITSIVGFSFFISYLLDFYPEHLFGFFFGLVLVSIPFLLSQVSFDKAIIWLCLFMGILIGLLFSVLVPQSFEASAWLLIPAGFIAISAMLLPGISGSFLLLLMGVYSVAVHSVKSFDLINIAALVIGALLGLLIFPKFIRYLLTHKYNSTMAFIIGIVMGALVKLWPWQEQLMQINRPTLWQSFALESEGFSMVMIFCGCFVGCVLTHFSNGEKHGD